MTRWTVVELPWFAVFLHRYETPDPRPTLHDHPWPFLSVILRGGYREIRRHHGTAEPVRVRWINTKRARDLHAITALDRHPTWTLLLAGPRSHTWGYLDPDDTWTSAEQHRHTAELRAALAQRDPQQEQ